MDDPRPYPEDDDVEENADIRADALADLPFRRALAESWGAAQEEDALVWESVWDDQRELRPAEPISQGEEPILSPSLPPVTERRKRATPSRITSLGRSAVGSPMRIAATLVFALALFSGGSWAAMQVLESFGLIEANEPSWAEIQARNLAQSAGLLEPDVYVIRQTIPLSPGCMHLPDGVEIIEWHFESPDLVGADPSKFIVHLARTSPSTNSSTLDIRWKLQADRVVVSMKRSEFLEGKYRFTFRRFDNSWEYAYDFDNSASGGPCDPADGPS